ncbi:hypothetical protein CSIM01_12140 [Colletotrichum simmondsii]|uniref:Uncharacterized protein n=1 Tax=Colletotrichum simmondsii TaxID=703756 RepID=A0A135TLV6_9PEZI|nr:hypothetical protein CSIM01_12140 [Colletotrichum simmondsii]
MEALEAKHEEEKCKMWAIYIAAIEQRKAENSRLKARLARERPRPTFVIDKTKNLPEVIQKRLGGVEGFVHNPQPVKKQDFSLRESIDVRREIVSSNQALAASNYALVASNESLASSNQVLASKIEAHGKVQQDLVSQQFMANFNLIQTYRGKSTMRPVPEFFDVNKSTSQASVPSQTSNAHVDVAEVAQASSKMIQVTKSTQTSDRTSLSFSSIFVSPLSTAPVMPSPANVKAVQFIEPTQNSIAEPVSLSSLVTSSPTPPAPTLRVEPEKTDSAKAELVLTTTKVTAPPASPLPLPSPLAALEKIVALPDSSVFSHSTLDEKGSSVHASPNLNLPSKTIEKMPSPGTSATELDAAAVISIQPQPQPKIAEKLPSLLGELSSDNMFVVQAKRLKETPSLGTSPRVGNMFEAKLKDAIVKPPVVPPPAEVSVLPALIPDVEPAPSTLTPPISQSPLAAVSVNSSAKTDEVPKTEELREPVPGTQSIPVTSQAPEAAAVAVIATPVVIPGLPVNNNSDQPDNDMDWETDPQQISQIAEPESDKEDDKMDEDSPLKLCSQSDFEDGVVSGSDDAPPTPSPAPRPNGPQPQQVLDEPMFDAPQIRPNRELEMDEAAVPSVDHPNVESRPAPEAEMTDVPGSASSESKLREVPENKEREWSSPPVSLSVTRPSPPPEFVEVEKVPFNVSPEPELGKSRENAEEERSSSPASLPTQVTSTPDVVEVDKVTVAAAPEPQVLKKPIRIKFVKKAANPLMTPVRPKKKTAAKGPDASSRSDKESPDALVVQAPDNWKSTAKADTGSKLVLLPVSSLKSVSQPRTDLPLDIAGSRKPSPLPKTIIEPDISEKPEERSPSPIVTHAPVPPAQSQKETTTTTTITEPEYEVPGEPKDSSPSPTAPQTPEPPVPGTGLLATPSTIPGLSWPAPPPPMPSVTQETLVLRDLSPEPEEAEPESDDDSDSEVEFLGIDEYIPERKIMPLRRRRLALALGPAPTPEASTSEAPPSRSSTPESEALSELPSDSDDDQAMSEDEEPAPRKIAPLRRRRLGDEQTQRAQAQEHEFRKKKLQEEQKELDEKAAKFRAPPPFPMVPAPFVVRNTPLKFNPLPAPNSSSEPSPASKLSPALLAVAPSLAGLVVVIGSPEVEDELKKSLEPLWDIIDSDQLKMYGPKSLTQLAIRRWGELMERKRYNKGQSIFKSMFDDLIDKWAELVVTETFVAHLIVPNDDESQAEIMDPWLEKIREARKK